MADRVEDGEAGFLGEGKRFFLHYDFPGYATNEPGGGGRPGRREIGHGRLAEKAVEAVQPENWPYAVRITCEVTSSNGSSSMASVVAACLACQDAGVPISAQVAGVSVGVVERAGEYKLLTDITGTEDHYGGMDFKVRRKRREA